MDRKTFIAAGVVAFFTCIGLKKKEITKAYVVLIKDENKHLVFDQDFEPVSFYSVSVCQKIDRPDDPGKYVIQMPVAMIDDREYPLGNFFHVDTRSQLTGKFRT